ncbi:MAG: YHS domain-containing protein, partial [Proteobacteria bacterium]|nr:YHS domain-containing protein [Pseudomonadota bacterium]
MAKDPVCGMEVDEQNAAATVEHKGKTLYFCNPNCKTKFISDPESYTSKLEEPVSDKSSSAPASPSHSKRVKKIELAISGMN